VYGLNEEGVRDPTPAVLSWTLDFTPPVTSITQHPLELSSSRTPMFVFACSDGPGMCSYIFLSSSVKAWSMVGGDRVPEVSIAAVTTMYMDHVSSSSFLSFLLSLTSGALSVRYEYRLTRVEKLGTQSSVPAPWIALPSGVTALPFNLTDGQYALDARVVGSANATSKPFLVDSSVPRARVERVEKDSGAGCLNVSLALEPHFELDSAFLNLKVNAVHYSLDGHSVVKVNGSRVTLRGLTAGAHTLLMKGENAVGSIETIGQSLSWVTSQDVALEEDCLAITPKPAVSSTSVAFDVSGSCSGHYKWRLDGSAWVEAIGTNQHDFLVTDSATHYWEALPVTNGELWTQPPVVHSWSKPVSSPTDAAEGLAVNVGTFLDGPHFLTVKAIDAVGNIYRIQKHHRLCLPRLPRKHGYTERELLMVHRHQTAPAVCCGAAFESAAQSCVQLH
jgi:hypothetical protein